MRQRFALPEPSEVAPRVFHFDFPTQRELTRTLLRFEEFYESPHFSGKVFNLYAFKEWYKNNPKDGENKFDANGRKLFTYYGDWRGFNVPSTALEAFFEGKFDPLSSREQAFIDSMRKHRGSLFYVIGTFGGDAGNALVHEVAHGLRFTNEKYCGETSQVVNELPGHIRGTIDAKLDNYKYNPNVWADETHAYLLTEQDVLLPLFGKQDDRITVVRAGSDLNSILAGYYPAHAALMSSVRAGR